MPNGFERRADAPDSLSFILPITTVLGADL
jgi:hypothetical protein